MLGQECDGAAAMAALRGDAMMLKTLARIHGARPASDRLPVTQLVSQWWLFIVLGTGQHHVFCGIA